MKKLIILLTALFMLMGISITSYAETKVPERVRVGIKYGSTSVNTADVSFDNGITVAAKGSSDYVIAHFEDKSVKIDFTDAAFVVKKEFEDDYDKAVSYVRENDSLLYYRGGKYYAVAGSLYGSDAVNEALASAKEENPDAYSLPANKKRIRIKSVSGKTLLVFSQEDDEIMALCDSEKGLIGFDGIKYREYLEFKRTDSAIEVIANVSMQCYLYGVVPSEIGPGSPLEAQKAQAVCARTYAVKNLNRHSKNGFNLCASTCCQVYFGTLKESERACKAVDETNGEIITYNGEIITAVYSAHSGGVTANVENVWGNPFPYLKSVDDPHCKDYVWEMDINYDSLTNHFNSKGYNLGKITNLKIDSISSDKRVTKITVTGTNGSKSFEREGVRTALGLKSQMFYISDGSLMKSYLTSSGLKSGDLSKMIVKTGAGDKIAGNKITVINGNKRVNTYEASGGNKISGSGYGHGVGLCQCGAMGFAEEGWDYIKILKYYYTGVEIQ